MRENSAPHPKRSLSGIDFEFLLSDEESKRNHCGFIKLIAEWGGRRIGLLPLVSG